MKRKTLYQRVLSHTGLSGSRFRELLKERELRLGKPRHYATLRNYCYDLMEQEVPQNHDVVKLPTVTSKRLDKARRLALIRAAAESRSRGE